MKEITLQQEYLGGHAVDTLYFGGGTPSVLETTELQEIRDAIFFRFPISPAPEITLEANPDDVSREKLRAWRSASINRLSIGAQSFIDEDLVWMNRAHTSGQAEASIEMARSEGFDDISMDLIYGTPALTDLDWTKNLKRAIGLGIDHLSCYGLTVEPGTRLQHMIARKKSADVDSDKQANQFAIMEEVLEAAGFEHYEISNFARPGKRSRHNSSYWQGKKYLGLGPSAHSYNGAERRWNVSDNRLYAQSLQQGRMAFESELLTETQKLNERLMISLRTIEGCDLATLEASFGSGARQRVLKESAPFLSNGQMVLDGDKLMLSRAGKLFGDKIAATLFFEPAQNSQSTGGVRAPVCGAPGFAVGSSGEPE